MGCSCRVIFFFVGYYLFYSGFIDTKTNVVIFISWTGHRSFCHHFASIICCVSLTFSHFNLILKQFYTILSKLHRIEEIHTYIYIKKWCPPPRESKREKLSKSLQSSFSRSRNVLLQYLLCCINVKWRFKSVQIEDPGFVGVLLKSLLTLTAMGNIMFS